MSALSTPPVDIPRPSSGSQHPHPPSLSVRTKLALPDSHSFAPSSVGTDATYLHNELQDNDALVLRAHSPASTMLEESPEDAVEGLVSGEEERAVALSPCTASKGPVAVVTCLCENKMTDEEKREQTVVPFLFYYNTKHQERLPLKPGICCFRHAQPCPVHHEASVPSYMYPPIPQLVVSPMGELVVDPHANGPTLSDLPLELFHLHIFSYLFDCELLKLGQTSRFFNKLVRPEVFRRCERLNLLDDSKFNNFEVLRDDMPSSQADSLLKRNLARYHKRMESLRAMQGQEIGPYWRLTMDFRSGFPRIVAWVSPLLAMSEWITAGRSLVVV